jgi:hypothetical protein
VLRHAFLITLLLATPAFGQVVTPHIFAPPCTGGHCLNATAGSTVARGASKVSAQKLACPAGTAYDARKGTCHVAQASFGATTHY